MTSVGGDRVLIVVVPTVRPSRLRWLEERAARGGPKEIGGVPVRRVLLAADGSTEVE